jgi:hypothetical protein
MTRLFAVVLAVACVAGSTSGFARGGMGHAGGFGGHAGGFGHAGRNPTTLLGNPAPQMPTFESRIPAPLASPSQHPLSTGRCPSPRSGV